MIRNHFYLFLHNAIENCFAMPILFYVVLQYSLSNIKVRLLYIIEKGTLKNHPNKIK